MGKLRNLVSVRHEDEDARAPPRRMNADGDKLRKTAGGG